MPGKSSCYLLPIRREVLESFAGGLFSSLREAHDVAERRIAELEAKLASAERERDEALAVADIQKEQLRRAAEALGFSI